jgi:hypothetical protein
MTRIEQCAAELRELARRVRRLPAFSRTQPHVFYEEKDEVAHQVECVAARLASRTNDLTSTGLPSGLRPRGPASTPPVRR